MNRSEGKTVLGVLIMVSAFFIFLWNLDLSVTSMLNGLVLTNGFWYVSPAKTYHADILGMTLIVMCMGGWIIGREVVSHRS